MGGFAGWARSQGSPGSHGILDYFQGEERKKAVMEMLRKTLPIRDNPEEVARTLADSGLNMEDAGLVIEWHKNFDDWATTKGQNKEVMSAANRVGENAQMPQFQTEGVRGIAQGLRDEDNQGTLDRLAVIMKPENAWKRPREREKAGIENQKNLLSMIETQSKLQAQDDERHAASIFDSIAESLGMETDEQKRQKIIQSLGVAGMRAKLPGASGLVKPPQDRALGLGDPGHLQALERAEQMKAKYRQPPVDPMVATENGLTPRSQVQPGTKPWQAPQQPPKENPALEDQRASSLMFKLYGASDLSGLSPDVSARAGEAVERMQDYR